ncbi:serine/threonine protein kinase [Nonomuraea aridisoli]|nr:serine/threonine protein kinase [Nonomuraea aridisoli]
MHPLRPGDPENLGAYVISGRLAEGPRGPALLGRESDDAPLRVIKLLPAPESDGDDVARFAGVQRVSSSYVARTLEAGRHGDQPYVVREYVEGRTLAEVVAQDGPLQGDALERMAVGVLTALTAVHLAGITHRGLTPHNVIIGSDGPRVTDADLGAPVGEVGYRAPEQINGLGYGPAADVFSWAALVVFAATGKPPFGQEAEAVLEREPEVGDLADPLRRAVLPALAKDAGRRPTTYMALLQLLGNKRGEAAVMPKPPVTAGAPIEGVPVTGVPPVPPMPPVVPTQQWGPPPAAQEPATGGPPHGAPLQAGPGPVQGVALPPGGPTWGPSQDAPQQPVQGQPVQGQTVQGQTVQGQTVQGQTVSSRAPRRPFPVGLAAAVGALALLSGVGLWGANQYASTQRFEPVALQVGASPSDGGAGITGTGNGVGQPSRPVQPDQPGQPGQPGTGQPQQNQPDVAVPWASTADPEDVAPMVLPTDWTMPTPPELSTVPSPPQVTQYVLPTTQATVPQPVTGKPTVTVTASGTATPTPTASEEPVVHPSGTSTATPEPTATPAPTVTVTVTPTPTVTVTPTPTPTPTLTPTLTVTVTPTQTVVQPTPTRTAARPTRTAARPTRTASRPAPTQTVVKPAPTSTKPVSTKPATAAPMRNPYSPVQVCGSGFQIQRAMPFAGGETVQLYNASTGENCVVTMKTADVGKPTKVTAAIEVQGQPRKTDTGMYEFYAGPVKLPGKGKCVRFEGSTSTGGTGLVSWANCG